MEIKSIISEISDSINNGKLVVFVGAGVSKNYGYPDWNQLTDKILNRLYIEKHSALKRKIDDSKCRTIKRRKSILKRQVDELGYATDEYLTYAQYLYENVGSKEYRKIIEELLEDRTELTEKSEIIDRIFDLAPQHIITTNYDTLLEDHNPGYYATIAENKDLAKTTLNKFIIKMHGDFKHKHFVLKESDYHNYKKNFSLIDNFIRSIFATHTILFLGFSANDPNFKQIYAWINEILNEDARNAFFVNLNKSSFDIYKTKYFENKKINLIHFEDLMNYHGEELTITNFGKRLEYCISKLNFSDMDVFMEKISKFTISKNPEVWGVEAFLKSHGIDLFYDKIEVKNNAISELIISKSPHTLDNRIILFKLLQKLTSNDCVIKFKDKSIKLLDFIPPLPETRTPKEIKLLTEFRYNELIELLDYYPNTPTIKNHHKLQRKAFLLHMISEYKLGYNVLTDLMDFYESKSMYFDYIKSGINRNCMTMFNDPSMIKFNYNQQLDLLPPKEIITIKEFLDYYYQQLDYKSKIEESSTKFAEILDFVKIFENGGMQYSTKIDTLKMEMINTFKVNYEEAICTSYYSFYLNSLKAYFISYFTESKEIDQTLGAAFGIAKVTNLEYNYIYYSLQFLKSDDLMNILYDSNKPIELKKNSQSRLIDKFENLLRHIQNLKEWNIFNTSYFINIINNFIILFSKIDLTEKEILRITSLINPLIFQFGLHRYGKYLNLFLENHQEFIRNKNNNSILDNFYQTFVNTLSNEKHLTQLSIARKILHTFDGWTIQKTLQIKNKGIVKIIELMNNERGLSDKIIGIRILISIFQNCSSNCQNMISKLIFKFAEDNIAKSTDDIMYYYCLRLAIEKGLFKSRTETNLIRIILENPLSEENADFSAYLNQIYQLKKTNIISSKLIKEFLKNYAKKEEFYSIFLFDDYPERLSVNFKARWLVDLLETPEKLTAFVNKYKTDCPNLIIKLNNEVLLKENVKIVDKLKKVLEYLIVPFKSA